MADFFKIGNFNNIGTKMKKLSIHMVNQGHRAGNKKETYNFCFAEVTRSYGCEIRGGKVFEKISRTKIFYRKWK
jgi:hypothetical protein